MSDDDDWRSSGANKEEAQEDIEAADLLAQLAGDASGLRPQGAPLAQPRQISDVEMFQYQLDGLSWLHSRWQQSVSGILADEMGLGKTLQSLAVLARLVEDEKFTGPFLIVSPLSVAGNWISEIARLCPQLKLLNYFGDKAVREGAQAEVKACVKAQPREQRADPRLDSLFHIVLTTYEVLMQDIGFLTRFRWR